MDQRLVEELTLANGLQICFYDCSRRIAGDRWYVKLLARIPVKIDEERFVQLGGKPGLYAEFLEATGGTPSFELHKERNFIDEREKDAVFEAILTRLKEHALNYLSHESFADKFLKKEIKSFLEKRTWYNKQQS